MSICLNGFTGLRLLYLSALLLLGHGGTLVLAAEVADGPSPGLDAVAVDDDLSDELSDEDFADEFGDEFADQDVLIADPFEPFNRAMFWFNDRLYFYVLKPVVRGYRVVPGGIRRSVDNFFENLLAPARAVNAVFQLKFGEATEEMLGFLVNSTVGVLGLFDMTRDTGLKGSNEDFGQTLGHYGLGQGAYLVLPFLGPSSVRDGLGSVVDGFANPIYVVTDTTKDAVLIKGFEVVNGLSLDKDTYEGIKRDALDPYVFIRNAYAQLRQNKVEH